jgi:hypothetical protein
MGGRQIAPPDIVVVHGSFASCATPPAVRSARGHFCSDHRSLAATEHISLLFRALAYVARV